MSFLSRLFGSKDGPPKQTTGGLTQRLQKLEADAEAAAPGYVGTSYNRAGDLALRSGDTDRAVGYYGRAIDAFLEDNQREAARGVANKIIRVRPAAVRTLCTLTWLDLAAKHSATALLHLRDYVAAAKDVDEYQLAANQVYEMARIIPESEFLDAAADALDGLDFSDWADRAREWAGGDGPPNAITDRDELALACLKAAVGSSVRGPGPEAEVAADDAPVVDEAEPGVAEGATDGANSDESKSRTYRWD